PGFFLSQANGPGAWRPGRVGAGGVRIGARVVRPRTAPHTVSADGTHQYAAPSNAARITAVTPSRKAPALVAWGLTMYWGRSPRARPTGTSTLTPAISSTTPTGT